MKRWLKITKCRIHGGKCDMWLVKDMGGNFYTAGSFEHCWEYVDEKIVADRMEIP